MAIAHERLTRTFLVHSPWTAGRGVVRALGAVQSQDYDGAKWALALRSGSTGAQVEVAFNAGEIVRTHVLRPTWHFVDPADIRWLLRLTGPHVMKRMAPYDRHLELDDRLFMKCNAVLEKALRDRQYLTRAEVKAVLARAGIPQLDVQRTAHLLMRAELDLVICSGPRRGKQFTYALLEERVAPAAARLRDEDLLDLTLRYFRTRSPATAQDFSWWSGLPMADARHGIEMARGELEPATIGGKTYWRAGGIPRRPGRSAHLLPNYDEFFIGYRDRSAIAQRLKSARTVTGGSAAIGNVVVIDGQLVGKWKKVTTQRGPELRIELRSRLNAAEHKRVQSAVRRYESFLGSPVIVRGLSPSPSGR